MSCSHSEESSCRSSHFFLWCLFLAVGVALIASLPEMKRYIRISTM